MQSETSLILRVCRVDLTSLNGFTWPSEMGAEVVAPDWEATKECGNGLHGWLYGQGDIGCSNYWADADAKWLVLEVPSDTIIMLEGKCKFPRAIVRFIGSKSEAADFIYANEPKAANVDVIGACRKAGDGATILVSALGTATAGNYSTATAGESGTATAGESGEIRIQWWDTKAERYRTVIGYIGEDNLEPNTPYKLDDQHHFIKA